MGFKEYKEQAKPQGMKASEMAESKEAFCIMGWELVTGEYKGQKTYQHRTDVIHLVDGKRNSESVFLPASKLFQNLFEGFREHPEYMHNLYLHMDGRAYDIDQYEGVCPCKHGSNGKAAREEDSSTSIPKTAVEDFDFFTPDGEEVKLSTQPGTVTAKQVRDYLTLCLALRLEPASDEIMEEWSQQQADRAILRLRATQATGNGKVKSK